MNFRQMTLLNDLERFMATTEEWKSKINGEIAEIYAKMGDIDSGGQKRGPVPGLKALKDRVEALEKVINEFK